MKAPLPDLTALLMEMPLAQETDVVLCRNRARQIAEALGFERQHQVKIATAVSEIARNAFRYAKTGRAVFALADVAEPGFLIIVADSGPGIANLDAIQTGSYRSSSGMGCGIRGAYRLMDRVEISTGPEGTTVQLFQKMPPGARVQNDLIEKVTGGAPRPIAAALDELSSQNLVLVETLDAMSVQRNELEEINRELTETNRGVVALYDELDTVHRVGRVVASKLDLDSLLSAITDATTELSGAEFGAFFYPVPNSGRLACQTMAGVLSTGLTALPSPRLEEVAPTGGGDIRRVDDLGEGTEALLGPELRMRSLLACVVRDSAEALVGALVLGHSRAGAFTERTERILSTVAVQVSIGIANATLYRDAQSANAAKDRFLAILSHELRTPLNPVFAILTALEEQSGLSDEVRADLVVMRRNLQLEARLIDDLLDLTRIAQGKMPLKLESQDLHALIHAVCRTCQEEIGKKRTVLKLALEAGHPFVRGDSGRLQQVLWNLLNNAVKFTPAGGTITLRTGNSAPGQVRFSIADTGRGIEPGALHRVFNPFEQGDRDVSSRFGGLGLGLAISKSIIDAHNGEIRVESLGVEKGTTFFVTLPEAEPCSAPAEPLPAPGASPAAGAFRILLVDDHEDTRMIMGRLLGLRGYKVTEAATFREALAVAREQEFDLLVSDLGLPDGHGHDLMRTIRKERSLQGIALSGYGMESDVANSLEAGFCLHLTKPVDFLELGAAIEKIRQKA